MQFSNKDGLKIVQNLILTIQQNKGILSQIDGEIGDGDHGINMSKGFTMAGEQIKDQDLDMSGALFVLSKTLLMRIGGSMGPLYGTLFAEMAKASQGKEFIDKYTAGAMIANALDGIGKLSPAKPGDKTMIDALHPAVQAYTSALENGAELLEALEQMKDAAEKGKESTRDLVSKIGRSSRLGERSRGVLDAGAVSCNLILQSFADTILEIAE